MPGSVDQARITILPVSGSGHNNKVFMFRKWNARPVAISSVNIDDVQRDSERAQQTLPQRPQHLGVRGATKIVGQVAVTNIFRQHHSADA
jgi:hypothetical protein